MARLEPVEGHGTRRRRGPTRNVASWAVVGGATFTMILAFQVPFLHRLFRFGPVGADDLAAAVLAGVLCLAWFEVLKRFKIAWLASA